MYQRKLGTLSIDDIQHAEPAIKQASIVIMQLETPIESVTYAAKMAKKDGITVILNPAPAPTQQLPDDGCLFDGRFCMLYVINR